MVKVLRTALRHAEEWLGGLDDRSVAATADLETLRSRIDLPLPDTGTDPETVVEELVAATAGGHLGSAGGRFYAWVVGGSVDSALAADWLASAWDQNAALYACGPAAAVVEERAGEWLKELLDLPRDASFAFTNGCQLAHVTALAAARYRVLQTAGWDVERDGLFGAPPIRVLSSEAKHGSTVRAIRFLGLGSGSLTQLEADETGRILPAALQDALAEVTTPTIVVLNAADLNVGAFDRFAELIPIARRAGAWVHVDGAFGLFARASRSKRNLLEGVEGADSWSTDGHKWLNVPYDCGIAVIRDREAHRAAMTLSASYLSAQEGARDQMDWNLEWSRRARGLPVYAALRELGRQGVEELVDRCCAHCAKLVHGIGSLPGAVMVNEPELNQGLIRFAHPDPDAPPEEQDRYIDEVIGRINATGEAFFSGTTWRGRRAMRVSVVNWRTSEADVERSIAAVSSVLTT